MVEILNRLGHCVSYSTVEELETELTFEAQVDARMTPYGMNLNPDLATGVAFDNYDEFVETATAYLKSYNSETVRRFFILIHVFNRRMFYAFTV